VAEILDYRVQVEQRLQRLVEQCDEQTWQQLAPLIALGAHHEQQHQELLFTDTLYHFSHNPLAPAYLGSANTDPHLNKAVGTLTFTQFDGGLHGIGNAGINGFSFDNESPRHQVYQQPYRLANRLITNGEYLDFINDQGYQTPVLWLSDGWAQVQQQQWQKPLYWQSTAGGWVEFSLYGLQPLDLSAPVTQLSYFEADAYATWVGKRLPTEVEWELAAASQPVTGNLINSSQLSANLLQPVAAGSADGLQQLYGDVWEWTASSYSPYPGFRPPAGPVGEYNGKFMCNQMVLRGGSCATPADHIRATYRNFFPADARWQFSGIRLAKNN
jgi:ergothioneine biosynthesis protein EgtB